MPRLGFSGHNVLPFETDWTMPAGHLSSYLHDVREARELYRGRVEIYLGIEADFIPGLTSPAHERIRALGLDYVLGSVHFIGPNAGDHQWTVDGPRSELEEAIRLGFQGDARKLVERYYQLLAEMARTAPPDIVSHFDVVKKNNSDGSLFSEEERWYREAVRMALGAVRSSGSVLEINTGALVRSTNGTYYPSPWILQEAWALDIPVMINADAHDPAHIDARFTEAAEILRDAGFRSQRQLTAEGWIDVNL